MIVFGRDLSEPISRAEDTSNVSFSLLSASDIDQHVGLRPSVSETEIRRRLARGHTCFVARRNGTIAHVCWAATGNAELDYLGCELELRATEVYLYGSYTAPDYRNMNMASVRSSYSADYFRARGYSRLIAVVQPRNKAAVRAVEKVGYLPLGVVGFVRLGPWRRFFHFLDGGRSVLPFRAGQR